MTQLLQGRWDRETGTVTAGGEGRLLGAIFYSKSNSVAGSQIWLMSRLEPKSVLIDWVRCRRGQRGFGVSWADFTPKSSWGSPSPNTPSRTKVAIKGWVWSRECKTDKEQKRELVRNRKQAFINCLRVHSFMYITATAANAFFLTYRFFSRKSHTQNWVQHQTEIRNLVLIVIW